MHAHAGVFSPFPEGENGPRAILTPSRQHEIRDPVMAPGGDHDELVAAGETILWKKCCVCHQSWSFGADRLPLTHSQSVTLLSLVRLRVWSAGRRVRRPARIRKFGLSTIIKQLLGAETAPQGSSALLPCRTCSCTVSEKGLSRIVLSTRPMRRLFAGRSSVRA